ncbi:hypothetical protein D3C73_861540 [compost metagenome]
MAIDPLRQLHRARHRRQDDVFRTQQLGNPLGRAGRPLQFPDHLAQGAERTADDQAVEHERRQLASGNSPGDDVHATNPEHHPDRAQDQHDHQGNQPGPLENAFARGVERLLHGHGKPLLVLGLMVVGLHGLDLPQGFGHITADIGNPVLTQA